MMIKVTLEQFKQDHQSLKIKDIAKKYGVCQGTISRYVKMYKLKKKPGITKLSIIGEK